VRATAAGFVYHQGAIFGGLTAPVITHFATSWHLGFAVPMAVGTILGCISRSWPIGADWMEYVIDIF
jgi:MFS transporter, SHS family, lactate transporter